MALTQFSAHWCWQHSHSTHYTLHTSGKDGVGHKGRLHHPTSSEKCKKNLTSEIKQILKTAPLTSRWLRWWWCSTRRWWGRGWWRWRGTPGSCRAATATESWSLSSTECRILEIIVAVVFFSQSYSHTLCPAWLSKILPLVSARSKKKRMGTENMMLVTQADNTNHLALLSGIKYKVLRYQQSLRRLVSLLTAPVEPHGMSDGVISVNWESHQHVSGAVSDHQLTKPGRRKMAEIRRQRNENFRDSSSPVINPRTQTRVFHSEI